MLTSSGIEHRVVRIRIEVSEECIAYIFSVENQPCKKSMCQQVATLRYIPEDGSIHK
jgi:hypothetical protein